MELAFDPRQAHQLDAIDAVLGLFRGAGPLDGALPAALLAHNLRELHGLDTDGVIEARVDTRGGEQTITFPNFAVEMETGTGKTYVYVRTMLELARRHGLRRFVVVVPSVAIREGVIKTLEITARHFAGLYPDVRYRFRAYDGRSPGHVRTFAGSHGVEILVITLDAFNKASNVLRQQHDRLGGDVPLWTIQDCRPVLVLDEPQNMESDGSIQALADLCPLFALRYSATHRRRYARVHRLSPAEAHRRRLVKRIEVAAVAGDDREARFSAQIRRTIETHLRRQQELETEGLKVLSLFFVDRVASYADRDGLVRRLFDHHYGELRGEHARWRELPAERVRAAYFAERRRRGGRRDAVDSRTGSSAEDEVAYQLIMRDKERLLDLDEPVAFLFSHSALREGWDNPNVFQICTLGQATSKVRKRQEIGRGARLPVDQQGQRVHDEDVNVLTVITNESYEEYVAGLQSEVHEDHDDDAPPPVPTRAQAGSRRGGTAAPAQADPGAWLALDSERLIRDVVAQLGTIDAAGAPAETVDADGPALADIVAEAVARDPANVRVTRRTIAAVLAAIASPDVRARHPWRVASQVSRALVAAVVEQIGG